MLYKFVIWNNLTYRYIDPKTSQNAFIHQELNVTLPTDPV